MAQSKCGRVIEIGCPAAPRVRQGARFVFKPYNGGQWRDIVRQRPPMRLRGVV
jgi:hypothetical protein